MTGIRKSWIGVVAGAAMLLAACGGGESQVPGVAGPTSAAPTSAGTVTTAPVTTLSEPPTVVPGAPTIDGPSNAAGPSTAAPTDRPPSGTVVVRTVTLSGVPVPAVPVWLALHEPCDPASRDIPLGATTEALRYKSVTDAAGQSVFRNANPGCYYLGMTAPAGTNPVPEGMHTVFLVADGDSTMGTLRFQDAAQTPQQLCSEATIESELSVDSGPTATIDQCDGTWAVVRWDTPGDNQRVITRTSGTWTTYVGFPHDTCWSTATADGVPDRLRVYFDC